MKTKSRIDWTGCPVRYAAGIFGDKWILMILRDVLFKGRRTYKEFHEAGEGISTNILADRLSKLEQDGILNRHRDPRHGLKVIYTASEKGRALIPVFLAMMDWSETYDPDTEVPADFARQLRLSRNSLEQRLIRDIESTDRECLGEPG